MYTVNGSLIDFSNAVGQYLPPVYIPKGYEINKLPAVYEDDTHVFPFELTRLMDNCTIRFAFHVPADDDSYWTTESNLRLRIPSFNTSRLINRVKRDMTRKKKATFGLGYYL